MWQKWTRVKRAMLGLVAFAVGGCAGMPTMAQKFNGVWVTTSADLSWVEVQSQSVVSFGLLSSGHCAATSFEIVSKDRVDAPVSAIGNGPMLLKLDGGALLIGGKLGTTRFVPATRESICLGRGGVYAPGAPYPKAR
ncbi:MAG: hypothetical protein RB191_00275 [Terriglobia bacterium]|nr:hypothetical protein [Terriglobia bacterium]